MSVLGIDLGGTKVAFLAESAVSGRYETTMIWPPSSDVWQDLAIVHQGVSSAWDAGGQPETVGIALPATVDRDGRVTSWPSRPDWVGLDWSGLLTSLLPGIPVRTADDGDLAALAEAEHAGSANVVYFGIGTGVGGGAVLDGCLIPGPRRGSCEIGHVIADPTGSRCACGRRGCLQAVASGPAVLRRAGELRGHETGFEELRQAWLAGQEWSLEAIRPGCAAVASIAVSMTEMLQAELVVVGGGFAARLPGFAGVVADHLAELARPGHTMPSVVAGGLGTRSSLYGAVLLAQ